MYRIAIIRKGQHTDRRTATTSRELRDIVWETIHSAGRPVTNYGEFTRMITDARRMADSDGFAALELGTTAITIRPATHTA